MNTKYILAAAALSLAGTAFAGEEQFAPVPVSTMSRAAVKADLAQAMARHELTRTEADFQQVATTSAPSTLSREQVRIATRSYVRSSAAANDRLSPSAIGN